MYLTIQFPFTDLRPLLGLKALRVPGWSTQPRVNEEFVHFFGEVRQRRKGVPGDLPWDDELFYATARRALTFPALEKKRIGRLGPPQGGVGARALYHDKESGVVIRVEIGVTARLGRMDTLDSKDCLVILRDFLSLPTSVARLNPLGSHGDEGGRVRGVIPAKPLVTAGGSLARLYLNASTDLGTSVVPGSVRAGEPLVFVLYKGDEIKQLTEGSEIIDPAKVNNATVSYTTFYSHNRLVGIWFIDIDSASGDALRRLRLGLGRLHAERQAMLEVLLAYKAHTLDACPDLVSFLDKRLGWLSQSSKYGIDLQAVRDIVSVYDAVRPRKDREELEKRIEEIRNENEVVAEKARDFVDKRPSERRGGVFVSYSHVNGKDKKRLEAHLKPLGCLYWDDSRIEGGDVFDKEIRQALAECRVAVLLVSEHFIASDYIRRVEVPEILRAAESGDLKIIPVFLTTVGDDGLSKFKPYQGIPPNSPTRPIDKLSAANRNIVFAGLKNRINKILGIESAH